MKIIDSTINNQNVRAINSIKLPENIIVFSHLRWDFVFQRPQHLLTRFAQNFNVTFIEEPIFDAVDESYYSCTKRGEHITVVVPHIPAELTSEEIKSAQKLLFDRFMNNKVSSNYIFWYYTPMALEFSRKHLNGVVIYDCMDELSAFKFAPLSLKILEKELLQVADLVFTGGHSLYEAKKNQHANIYPFPSSIEKEHFLKARINQSVRARQDQAVRLGFYGVIDERFDVKLIKDMADARPHWEFELIGPVVKIDPDMLPRNSNIHYLGSKSYHELPAYLASWDIALIPFVLNESTRYISPTKTPEYLAAGLPVISTPIKDVINPYGKNQFVNIGCTAADFIAAAERELKVGKQQRQIWLSKVDTFLAKNSWDKTCEKMLEQVKDVISNKTYTSIAQ